MVVFSRRRVVWMVAAVGCAGALAGARWLGGSEQEPTLARSDVYRVPGAWGCSENAPVESAHLDYAAVGPGGPSSPAEAMAGYIEAASDHLRLDDLTEIYRNDTAAGYRYETEAGPILSFRLERHGDTWVVSGYLACSDQDVLKDATAPDELPMLPPPEPAAG